MALKEDPKLANMNIFDLIAQVNLRQRLHKEKTYEIDLKMVEKIPSNQLAITIKQSNTLNDNFLVAMGA